MVSLFKKKQKSNLETSDLVLLAMMFFPNGAMGESIIHEFLYELSKNKEFENINIILDFEDIEGHHYSSKVHESIKENCKDISSVTGDFSSPTSNTYAIFADDLRFESYEEVMKREEHIKNRVGTHTPKIYYLTSIGRSVAIAALRERLTKEQKKALVGKE